MPTAAFTTLGCKVNRGFPFLRGRYIHRQGLQFALGLILGDFTMASIWLPITLTFEVPTYRIYI